MSTKMKSAEVVFDNWARDYHADGMEKEHWETVAQAYQLIPESTENYLEVGVGNGYGLYHMATHQFSKGQCWGLDVSSEMVNITKQRIQDLENAKAEQGDFLLWTPPKGLKFSLIFSMEVFYYFHDIQKGIEKAASLLDKNGTLMVAVNFFKESPLSHSWPEDVNTPMQLWSADDYKEGFLKAGFQKVKQHRFYKASRVLDEDGGTLVSVGVMS